MACTAGYDKMDAMPIQAADLLAWEFAKNLDDTWLKSKFPTRASLKTLLRSKKPPHSVCHIEGAALREYLSEVRKLSLAPDYD